ncbi:3-hydroxyacyl-CoA dehydrogenase NAD-binding domain-containing protein [Methylomicrobium sp. Wu6]|uniref:3-hydroxyacyl-CoA dehydrogenase/enoyl-CoA hydratase family protein n=1 Tax=Methylomicrobium sp. Wu6 TaxID=3107928 RepID=UPI002DD6B358|nr:3-hydroxyacyl-CoA dehydrogenase NAD-binding domain-containing protein [Methylomicrobium sp. Wu6]MEC4750175.1 3-hydroxyacyl-CoA dehydrogenase NAD-binding domain-containing protein [Methylomicrobium sp. Wu6]
MNIQHVAVIGAGVMGASIAAHIANAGCKVILLDIVPENAADRSTIAKTAIEKLLKADPAPFMHKDNARLITPGNIEDDLPKLAEVDWVIEAVIEHPGIKKSLYQKLDSVCRNDCIISSNTSTLPLRQLVKDLPESFRHRFLISHFFNPPRYMRLLELVSSPDTRPDLLEAVSRFADRNLGKNCVVCHDTPGFIGNRIGIYWTLCGLHEAINLGLTVEQADAAVSTPFGIPKTGIFGLLDLVGLDLIPHILTSMAQALPPGDAFHRLGALPEVVQKMIADGYTGRKGKGGFYRLNKQGGGKIKESIDLGTGNYAPSIKPDMGALLEAQKSGFQALLSDSDPAAVFAWRVMSKTLAYAARLAPDISDDLTAIDAAMRDGYNWKFGPFELLDRIGVAWFVEKLEAEKLPLPPLLTSKQPLYIVETGKLHFTGFDGIYRPVTRAAGVELLSDVKLRGAPVLQNRSSSLWDAGDGVACLEFHSKMNTLDMEIMELIRHSVDKVQSEFKALVIHNEGENFSAGANLGLLMHAIDHSDWAGVAQLITTGQQTYQTLKYAPFPVVAAPSGLALGGGCEILLHCDAIQAHAELYMGLVEVGVGLIPGWGGCKEYLRRWLALPKRPGGPIPPIVKAFQTISLATVSKSAVEAKELLFLGKNDGITMNKLRLLADAKAKALTLAENYAAPQPSVFPLPGKTARVMLNMGVKAYHVLGKATDYDLEVLGQLARVLSGGDSDITQPLSEEAVLALECEAFVELVKNPGTLARLDHMLKTGKPLRN